MDYMDEEILDKREALKAEQYRSLETGVYMDGAVVQFQNVEVLDEFRVFLPETMKQMPRQFAMVKYPSEFRPQMIITTLDLSVNMGFSVFPNGVPCDDLPQMALRMRAAVHRSNPDCQMFACETLQKIPGSWFAFRSHAMDMDVYNMILVTTIDEKLVQGSFNCYYKDYPKWKEYVLMMWETIRQLTEEEKKNACSKNNSGTV